MNSDLLKFLNRHVFVFLPWLAFWNQAGTTLPDLARIRVGLAPYSKTAKVCSGVKKTFNVRIASSGASRSRGLGGRYTPLAHDEGMLFVFEKPQIPGFWMKDTMIPLEIAFFGPDSRLTEVLHMPVERDPAHPKHQYQGRSQALVALEAAPGALTPYAKQLPMLCADTINP